MILQQTRKSIWGYFDHAKQHESKMICTDSSRKWLRSQTYHLEVRTFKNTWHLKQHTAIVIVIVIGQRLIQGIDEPLNLLHGICSFTLDIMLDRNPYLVALELVENTSLPSPQKPPPFVNYLAAVLLLHLITIKASIWLWQVSYINLFKSLSGEHHLLLSSNKYSNILKMLSAANTARSGSKGSFPLFYSTSLNKVH